MPGFSLVTPSDVLDCSLVRSPDKAVFSQPVLFFNDLVTLQGCSSQNPNLIPILSYVKNQYKDGQTQKLDFAFGYLVQLLAVVNPDEFPIVERVSLDQVTLLKSGGMLLKLPLNDTNTS